MEWKKGKMGKMIEAKNRVEESREWRRGGMESNEVENPILNSIGGAVEGSDPDRFDRPNPNDRPSHYFEKP